MIENGAVPKMAQLRVFLFSHGRTNRASLQFMCESCFLLTKVRLVACTGYRRLASANFVENCFAIIPTQLWLVVLTRCHSIRGLHHAPC